MCPFLHIFADFEQVIIKNSHFADSEQVIIENSHFSDFEQVIIKLVILLTLNKSQQNLQNSLRRDWMLRQPLFYWLPKHPVF